MTILATSLAAALAFAGLLAGPSRAACPPASVAVARAFHISRWVVHARLIAADDHWAGPEDSWTLFHAQILHAYKGRPPPQLAILTHGDDAGLWLDRGSLGNVGQDYLLFLRAAAPGSPVAGAAEVSDRCGQSKPWALVPRNEVSALEGRPVGRAPLAKRGPRRSKAKRHRARPQAEAVATEPYPARESFEDATPHPTQAPVVEAAPQTPTQSRRWRWPAPLRKLFHPHASASPTTDSPGP
jgi:hypothetical protein